MDEDLQVNDSRKHQLDLDIDESIQQAILDDRGRPKRQRTNDISVLGQSQFRLQVGLGSAFGQAGGLGEHAQATATEATSSRMPPSSQRPTHPALLFC